MNAEDLIFAAINQLENMPCGGVGDDGMTQHELDDAVALGEVYDATYHNAQQAYLFLREALDRLRHEYDNRDKNH